MRPHSRNLESHRVGTRGLQSMDWTVLVFSRCKEEISGELAANTNFQTLLLHMPAFVHVYSSPLFRPHLLINQAYSS